MSAIGRMTLLLLAWMSLILLVVIGAGCDEDPSGLDRRVIRRAALLINDGTWVTGNNAVVVTATADVATAFRLGNEPACSDGVWLPMNASPTIWILPPPDGLKRIHCQFAGPTGTDIMTASADILLDMTPPDVSPVAPIDPVDGARDLERPVSLAWTAARDDGAGLAFYRVLCDSMATPSRTAWVDSALSGTLWGANRLTTYRWRVEAVDRAGNLATAGPWDFTTSARPEASVLIPAGVFTMGSPLDEIEHQEDEVQHVVQLTRGFRLSRFEITAGQYVELLQWAYEQGFVAVDAEQAHVLDNLDGASVVLANLNNGFDPLSLADGRFTAAAPDRPIMGLTWFGAVAYCDWLSLREGLPRAYDHATWSCNDGDVYGATGYRLPTESEWEYACRAGATTAFPNGEITDSQDDPLLDLIAWYLYNPYPGLAPVGLLASNAWGLHDMLGNAPEWVHDAYGAYPDGTPENPARDPVALSGAGRVVRGGLYVAAAWGCRAAIRQRYAVSHEFAGLRVALTLPVGNRPY